ncbi:HAD family hydrolase [Neobacillus sp. PS3-40]|uniref:HAD family hydrolase n=1 Tax=Neobacillus sp. PS3-40 TaxID=3070679 RepID=UPI0027E0F81F|nr:HAD family hydrolase [Neobacillus sp. PS3-40]WML42404.1 HAD family hydrolase [Neobacillus sp. PS3-40]
MKSQTLIFDLDDTLIQCNEYFREATNKFANQIHEWFPSVSIEEINEKQLEIDVKSVEENGLNSARFPESLVSTYVFFSERHNREVKESEVQRIRTIGQSVFQVEVQPLPHMYEALNELQEDGHQLYLFTGGDEANQNRKVHQLELFTYFEDRIFIFNYKNTDALKKVLDKIECDYDATWVIGNSLRTDILPGLELGLNTIHIPAELEWNYNNNIETNVQNNGKMRTLKSLRELPQFIRENSYERCE